MRCSLLVCAVCCVVSVGRGGGSSKAFREVFFAGLCCLLRGKCGEREGGVGVEAVHQRSFVRRCLLLVCVCCVQ